MGAMRAKGWEVVRLRGKRPTGSHWQVTKDADEVGRWIAAGDNIGLVCHQRTGVLVLDPDEALAWAEMIDGLGQPCAPWVITGSGRLHYYVNRVIFRVASASSVGLPRTDLQLEGLSTGDPHGLANL